MSSLLSSSVSNGEHVRGYVEGFASEGRTSGSPRFTFHLLLFTILQSEVRGLMLADFFSILLRPSSQNQPCIETPAPVRLAKNSHDEGTSEQGTRHRVSLLFFYLPAKPEIVTIQRHHACHESATGHGVGSGNSRLSQEENHTSRRHQIVRRGKGESGPPPIFEQLTRLRL